MSEYDGLTREELIAQNIELRRQIEELRAEVEMLRSMLTGGGSGGNTAPFIKPNRAQRREAERQARKKRTQSFTRKRDVATEEVRHAVESCPDCGRKLSGGWECGRRQEIEIPEVRAKIVDHVLIARRCGVCGKVHIPKLGISEGVIGKQRLGVR